MGFRYTRSDIEDKSRGTEECHCQWMCAGFEEIIAVYSPGDATERPLCSSLRSCSEVFNTT